MQASANKIIIYAKYKDRLLGNKSIFGSKEGNEVVGFFVFSQ